MLSDNSVAPFSIKLQSDSFSLFVKIGSTFSAQFSSSFTLSRNSIFELLPLHLRKIAPNLHFRINLRHKNCADEETNRFVFRSVTSFGGASATKSFLTLRIIHDDSHVLPLPLHLAEMHSVHIAARSARSAPAAIVSSHEREEEKLLSK